MFLHISTRIEGKKDDGLFKKKGFSGYPSLAYLDQGGELIAFHSDHRNRNATGLTKTAERADAYLALRKKARSGDAVATQYLFVENLGLGRYDFLTGSLKLSAMSKSLPAKLKAAAEQKLVDVQYKEMSGRLRSLLSKKEIERAEYTRRYNEMNLMFFEAGRLPGGYRAGSVLGGVMNHAFQSKNTTLYEKALQTYKERALNPRALPYYERRLEQLKADGGK